MESSPEDGVAAECRPRTRGRRSRSKGCCNSQICCSYVLALMASGLVVGGVCLSLLKWDRMWLVLSASGLVLTFIGACMYYCGNLALEEKSNSSEEEAQQRTRTRRRKQRRARHQSEQLVSSAPQMRESRSVSQLSLNMIPQYFSPMDTNSLASSLTSPTAPASMAFSQIFSVNGQSFLILPISGDPVANAINCSETNAPLALQSLVVKMPTVGSTSEALSRKASVGDNLSKSNPANSPPKGEQESQTEESTLCLPNQCRASGRLRHVQQQTSSYHSNDRRAGSIATGSNQPQARGQCSSSVPLSPGVTAPSSSSSSVTSSSTCGLSTDSASQSNSHLSSAANNGSSSDNSGCLYEASASHSLRRKGTFKQNKSTVISFNQQQHSSQGESSLTCVSNAVPDNATNGDSNAFVQPLIDLESEVFHASNGRQQTRTDNTEIAEEMLTIFSGEASVGDEDIEEYEATPPPSYDEVLSIDLQDYPRNLGHNQNADYCGTL